MSDLGLIFSQDEIDQIISGQGTPPSIQKALKEGATLRRVKRDSIYSTLRFCDAGGAGTIGNVPLAAGTFQAFSGTVGQAGVQGFIPALTFAQTNLRKSGQSPFSGIFVSRRLNIYIYGNSRAAANNSSDEVIDTLVNYSPLTFKKGTSFEWNVGPVKKAVNFRGNKLYSVVTDANGYGIGDGYDLGIPFVIAPEETLAAELLVPNPAVHGLTLPATYVTDITFELDGDAVELVSQ